jgi:dTDP-4-dehydro-6-deoxy-alpha-D-glucopyranose 2,3-dehydratase
MVLGTSQKVIEWLSSFNSKSAIRVESITFSASKEWVFTPKQAALEHRTGGFFSVMGLHYQSRFHNNHVFQQPIIYQPEIGILGFLAKRINGELHLLAQAKVEPGNVNIVQLGPTLQATESNYKGLHGGSIPAFLSYFTKAKPFVVLVDQLQSEQGSRFYKKRNRNMVVLLQMDFVSYMERVNRVKLRCKYRQQVCYCLFGI